MSYAQAMKWQKKHPKGTRQYMGFDSCSGFTPAIAWIDGDWMPYIAACREIGAEPLKQRRYYDLCCRPHIMADMPIENRAKYTKIMADAGKEI